MNPTLPEGLITIGHSNAQRSSLHPDHTDTLFERLHTLHSFWKVHAVRLKVSKSVADDRCQNLFWRVWSSYTLSRTISTSLLIHLWQCCQKELSLESFWLEHNLRSRTPEGQQQGSPPSKSKTIEKHAGPHLAQRAWTTDESSSSSIQQPYVEGNKDSGRSTEVLGDLDHIAGTSRRNSQTSRPRLNRASSSGNRALYGASAARNRNRPPLNRRKSSQVALPGKPTRISKSSLKSPEIEPNEVENAGALLHNTSTSNFQLPSPSSWEDEPTSNFGQTVASTSCTDPSSELVIEPNFRNKFAERIASSGNLAGMSRMKKSGSVVRFADEIPVDLRRSTEQDVAATSENPDRPEMRHRGSIVSIASDAISDEDDMPSPGLQRTKSQLSMLIDETIARNGRKSFENLPNVARRGRSKVSQQEGSEEDKLLAMAHKEGVTKAGGAQLSRRFRLSAESESRYSSPSPPPLF